MVQKFSQNFHCKFAYFWQGLVKSKIYPYVLWIFNISFLLLNRIYDGYSFSLFGFVTWSLRYWIHLCFNFFLFNFHFFFSKGIAGHFWTTIVAPLDGRYALILVIYSEVCCWKLLFLNLLWTVKCFNLKCWFRTFS